MNEKDDVFPTPKKEKTFGIKEGVLYGIGCGVGGSIFILLGTAIEAAGPGILISLTLGGILIFFTALNYSELSTSLPISGGAYNFTKEGMGGFLAFIIGFFLWIANTTFCSFSAQSFSIVLVYIFPFLSDILILPLAILIIILISVIVFRTVELAVKTLIYSTMILIGIFVFFVFSGLIIAPVTNPQNFDTEFLLSSANIFGTIQMFSLLFISFSSITSNLAHMNPDIKNPKKNIPKINIIAILTTLSIYLLIALVSLLNIDPGSDIVQSPVLMADILNFIFGPVGFYLIAFGAIISTIIAMNAAVGSAMNVLYALGRDHYVPQIFTRVNEKTEVPTYSLVATVIVALFFTLITTILSAAATTSFIYLFGLAFVNFAAVALRYKRKELDRPFKGPFFPYLPLVLGVTCLILAFTLSLISVLLGLIIFIIALVYYLFTLAERHSVVITLAGLKFFAVIILGFCIWITANFSVISSPISGFSFLFDEILLRVLIYIGIFTLGTVVFDIIPLREFIYFFIRKLDKESIVIGAGGGQIIELDKKKSKFLYYINQIIGIIQLISAGFMFILLSLFYTNIINIEMITFQGIKLMEIGSEFIFNSVLIIMGVLLTFGGISFLYFNQELRKIENF